MTFLSHLSFNLRQTIFSFLAFWDLKSLIFLNKKIFIEIMIILKDRSLIIKQKDIFRLNKNQIHRFLKTFQNIISFDFNCHLTSLFFVISALPRKLKYLKFSNIDFKDLYNSKFWEELSEQCLNLETISFKNCDEYHGYFSRREETPNFKLFLKTHPKLKTVCLKFNKNMNIGMLFTSIDLSKSLIYSLSFCKNSVETLVFQNTIFPIAPEYECARIKSFILRNCFIFSMINFGFCFNWNFFSLCKLFPNLESICIIDYLKQNNKKVEIYDVDEFFRKNNQEDLILKLRHFVFSSYGVSTKISVNNLMDFFHEKNLVTFSNAGNRSLSISFITELMKSSPNLIDLNFDYTIFDDNACQTLSSSLIVKNLRKLSFEGCSNISHEGFKTVLENCSCLISLNVKRNENFRNQTIDSLLICGDLEEIYLSKNNLDDNSICKILKRFKGTLKNLEISQMEKCTKFLFKKLNKDKFKCLFTKHLNISKNQIIDSENVGLIGEIFPNLEKLNLKSCRNINLDCLDLLIKTNLKSTLEKMNLRNCCFFGSEEDKIFEKLKKIKKLVYFKLFPGKYGKIEIHC